MIELRVEYDGRYIIDSLVESITWSGDILQAARWVTVVINNTTDGIVPLITFEEGRELRIYDDNDIEIFRGIIFYQSINSKGVVNLKAYDENIYLTKNSDSRKFVNMKASDIVRRLCDDFGISYGTIADTGYVIPKLILRNYTLWDMMITALTETRKQTGRRFYIYSDQGRLHLVERKEKVAALVVERGTNLIRASYFRTIEDLRNKIRVIADSEAGSRSVTVQNQELINRYGLMQYVETMPGDATTSELKQRANKLLDQLGVIKDEATIEAIGDLNIRTGMAVYAVEPMTGILGAYYVVADEHVISNGVHKMYLTLSATDDLPTLEYVPPAESATSGAQKSSGGVAGTSLDTKLAEAIRRWNEANRSQGGNYGE